MSNITISTLTEQQEDFAQHYAIHRRPSEAYRYAYHCSKMNAQSIAVAANRLINNAKVALRIYELQQIVENEFKVDIMKKKHWLYTIASLSCQTITLTDGSKVLAGDPKVAIAAIAELNKMDGDHAAIKSKVDLNAGFDPTKLKPISELFDDGD